MPKKLEEVRAHACRLIPGRLVLTEEAMRSAGRCRQGTVDEWREIAASLPSVLWRLHVQTGDREPIERGYKERTGYELALRESGTTRSNKEFERIRTVEFDGSTYVTWPHIKGRGHGSRAFRLFHTWDSKHKRIIVGHCGHLNNAKSLHMH